MINWKKKSNWFVKMGKKEQREHSMTVMADQNLVLVSI